MPLQIVWPFVLLALGAMTFLMVCAAYPRQSRVWWAVAGMFGFVTVGYGFVMLVLMRGVV